MPNKYSPDAATYRRIVKDAARAAIRDWLHSLRRSGMYLFTVDGVECALEYFEGHWGFEEDGRWRWGRTGAGDPDEDLSGEDVLLEVALGRALPPQRPTTPCRRRDLPAFCGEAGLARAEIRALTAAHARENLDKIVLQSLPRA